MKLTPTLLLAVATASLALASCSSEPSDWRPDEKVSLDVVAPGTRDSEDYDHSVPSGTIENVHTEVMQEALAEQAAANGAPMPDAVRPEPADDEHLPTNTEHNASNPIRPATSQSGR